MSWWRRKRREDSLERELRSDMESKTEARQVRGLSCMAYSVQSVSSWLEGGMGLEGSRFASQASFGNRRISSWNRFENSMNVCAFNCRC